MTVHRYPTSNNLLLWTRIFYITGLAVLVFSAVLTDPTCPSTARAYQILGAVLVGIAGALYWNHD